VLRSRQSGSNLKPGKQILDADARIIASSEYGVVVALKWRVDGSDDAHRQYQAIKLREGLVFDIQDYRQERAARLAIRASS
jgi:hypothetical protein